MNNSYKVCVIGEGGCGKTTWVKRCLIGEYEEKYVATLGVEVHPLKFNTNYGKVTFNVWDTAGVENFAGLGDGYYVGSHAAILIRTCDGDNKYLSRYKKVITNTPIIEVIGKCDLGGPNYGYLELSTKDNINVNQPWLILARKLTGHEDLVFLQ